MIGKDNFVSTSVTHSLLFTAIPGDQCLGVTLINVADWRREVNEDPLPLSAKSTLTWAG